MRIGICDDEIAIRGNLSEICKSVLEDMGVTSEVLSFSSAEEVMMEKNVVDILILDIELPGMDGLQLKWWFQETGAATLIIYVSVHQELMPEAFGVHVFEFVQKERLEKYLPDALRRAIEYKEKYILLHGIPSKDIVYIETRHTYSDVYFPDGTREMLRISSNELERALAKVDFVRINRSSLVNLRWVEKWHDGSVKVTGRNEEIVVSVRQKTKSKKKYEEYARRSARFY